ncbi:MAG TPA: ABC transporter permease [Blastocatellia bacterium]|jgi:putative ABC transport system permease protein|nr:ABC transporter permease [Blastocatellia bacterium]
MLSRLKTALRALLRRSQAERELDEELRYHIEQQTEQNIRLGMNPEEARHAARKAFGGVEQAKERSRDARGVRWIEDLWQDLRYGARMLLKSPGFTLVAAITLGLGIGANTTIFSAIDSLILHPFALPNQSRLVVIYERNLGVGITRNGVAPGNLRDWSTQSQTFERFVSWQPDAFDLAGADQPERVFGYRVSTGFFAALGVQPLLGRDFQPDEGMAGREQVVILKHSLWRQRFGSDPNILGQSIRLNSKAYTVIGVMPKDFNFPYNSGEFWTPFVFPAQLAEDRENHTFRVFGLLKPGVSLAQGDAELRALSLRAQRQYPATNSGVEAVAVGLNEEYTRDARAYSSFTIGAVAFVLLIACANVANLLLARGSARQKELAVRMALGANRWRVMRQLLTESLLLALLGGFVGLAFSVWGITALANAFPQSFTQYMPGWEHLGINAWALGFTMLVSLLTGVLCGLLPAWQATKADFNETLKDGGKGAASSARNRWRNILVVAEVALSLVLLAGAGLLIRSFIIILNTDPGFNPDNALVTRIILPEDRYSQPEQIINFYQELTRRVAALPGVAAVGEADGLPLGGWSINSFQIVGQPPVPKSAQPTVGALVATPGYFAAIGTPLRAGRLFTARDDANAPRVALVNEAFAQRYFAEGSAIGQRLTIDEGPPSEIVGVVANTISSNLDDQAPPGVYQPFAQRPNREMALIVRGQANQTGQENVTQVVGAIRKELAALDANLSFSWYLMLREFIAFLISPRRVITTLLGIFALLALAMATVGLYAVMSFAVAQRTHEIGIRLALGAQKRDVIVIVVKQGLRLVSLGISIGLLGAFAVTRVLSQILYGVKASDPITYAMVGGLLFATALVACIAPARRATNVDPIIALRAY